MITEEIKSIQSYKKMLYDIKENTFLIENHRSYCIMPTNEENNANLAFNRHQFGGQWCSNLRIS